MRTISSQFKHQVPFKQQNSGASESPRSKEDIGKKRASSIDIYDCMHVQNHKANVQDHKVGLNFAEIC